MQKLYIGITGKKGHGKDTIADYIVENYDAAKLAFAYEIKEWIKIIDPILPFQDGHVRLSELLKIYTFEELKRQETESHGKELRRLAQLIGTEIGRERIGEDFWIKQFEKFAEKSRHKIIIVSDMRFVNESECVKSKNGLIWRVVNENIKNEDKHKSETEMDNIIVNNLIYNNTTKESLYKKIDRILVLNDVKKVG